MQPVEDALRFLASSLPKFGGPDPVGVGPCTFINGYAVSSTFEGDDTAHHAMKGQVVITIGLCALACTWTRALLGPLGWAPLCWLSKRSLVGRLRFLFRLFELCLEIAEAGSERFEARELRR